MIITSRKFAVIQMISYLSRESRMSTTTIASDSAADTIGRRSTASQKKLSRPHVKQKASFGTRPVSLQTRRPSAAKCRAAIRAIPSLPRGLSAAAQRLVRDAREGGIAGGPCPAMTDFASGTRTAVIKRY
jgi:hypothetical protein